MAKVQQYRKTLANLGTLAEGQLGYATDTNEWYFGTATGNKLLSLPNSALTQKGTSAQRTLLGASLTIAHQGLPFFDNQEQRIYHWGGTEWV